VAIEPSEIPWVKVFTKRKVKEFSQCTTAEKAEIFRILDITEKLMLSYFNAAMPCFTQSSSAGFCGTWEKSVRLCTSLIKFSSTNLLICPKTVETTKSRFFFYPITK
jgi:hypothetical protein